VILTDPTFIGNFGSIIFNYYSQDNKYQQSQLKAVTDGCIFVISIQDAVDFFKDNPGLAIWFTTKPYFS